MQVIKGIAYGLVWRSVRDKFSQAESALAKEKIPRKSFCRLDTESGKSLGVGSERVPKEGCRSAAAIISLSKVAATSKNAAFLTEVEEGLFSLVCVSNGLPNPGYDFIGPKDGAISLLEDFYTVASINGSVSFFADTGERFQGSMSFSFTDMVKEAEAQDSKKAIAGQVKNSVGDIAKIGVVGVVFVACLLGYFGYSSYKEYKQQQVLAEAARIQAEQAAQRRNPEVQYKMALERFLSEASAGLNVNMLWSQLAYEPNDFKTWRRTEILCDTAACQETWEPKSKAFVNWSDWNSYERRKELLFNELKVKTSRDPAHVQKPPFEQAETFFGNQSSFIQWVDTLESVKKGTLKVDKPKEVTGVPVVQGKPSYTLRGFEYKGPLWAATIPVNSAGFVVTEAKFSTPNLSGTNLDADQIGSFEIKGTFYEKHFAN